MVKVKDQCLSILFYCIFTQIVTKKKKRRKLTKVLGLPNTTFFFLFFFSFLSLCLSYTYWNNDVLVDGTSNVDITEIRTKIFDNLLTQLPLRLSNQYRELILFSFVPPFPLISPAFQMIQQTVL